MNESDFSVRRATLGDVAVLTAFNIAMARETEARELDPEVVANGVRGLFQRTEAGFYVVAHGATETIGALMVTSEWSDWRAGYFWWIQSVYVEPGQRRRGVFRALYGHVCDHAAQRPDIRGIRLYVERHNRVAQDTYHALGMIETTYRMYELEFPAADGADGDGGAGGNDESE